jgi:integrase
MKFTEKFILALKPKKERYDVREKSGKGFAIRVSSSDKKSKVSQLETKAATKSWVFFYVFEGRKRRMTLGTYPALTLKKAREKHAEALTLLQADKDPSLEKQRHETEARNSYTVRSLIREYMEVWAIPNKRSWQADERCLNKDVIPFLGKRKAKDITRRDVILLLDKIKERGAPIQANRTLACVRRLFNFAIERDLISASPCVAVKPVAKENRRDRVLSVQEIKNLWQTLDNYEDRNIQISLIARYALKFQLATTQRKGEVVKAEWREVCMDSCIWTIPAEKVKNKLGAHRVPLSALALDLLEQIKKMNLSQKWIFPSEKKRKRKKDAEGNSTQEFIKRDTHISGASIDHAIRRSVFKGIASFVPHDLRRVGASYMTSLGVSRLTVSKILNHADKSVTAVYDRHSYDAEKRHALELWSNKLHEILIMKGQ